MTRMPMKKKQALRREAEAEKESADE